MKFWIHIVLLAVTSVAVQSACPAEWFTSVFVATLDQTVASPLVVPDPDLTFLRDTMLFRDAAIEHTIEDAIQFFNAKFGLDFSQSAPNEQNERFYENATMFPFVVPPEIQYIVTYNRWIVNGNTRSTCYAIRDGGFLVSFSGDQMLFGSYGGSEGKPAGPEDLVVYGFYNIDVCPQQPVIIQYQSGTPFRTEPVDRFQVINCDLYSRVLGVGKAQGIAMSYPTPEDPTVIHHVIRNAFTFPANP